MTLRLRARIATALTITLACAGALVAFASTADADPISGYWGTDSAGVVRADGDAPALGDLRGMHLNAPIVGITATGDGRGYWLVAADGGVFTFGNARFYGSAGNLHLNAPIVGMAASADDHGYWLAASDGGVFTFGNAPFVGSAAGHHLNAPIVGIIPGGAPGAGYRLAASDGGVFTFGTATFRGSAGNLLLHAPIVGIAAAGDGYRLVASDGGVFTYGSATFAGASSDAPVSAITTTFFGGYATQAAIGGSPSAFGSAPSCFTDLPPRPDPSRPRFVGIATAFNRSTDLVEGPMAAVNCPIVGGQTGAFHARPKWHIDVGKGSTTCSVSVLPVDHTGTPFAPGRGVVERTGVDRIMMRSTQMAGHSVFDLVVFGFGCRAVVSSSSFVVQGLPFTKNTAGDSSVFSGPVTVHASGTCTTQIRAEHDGHVVQRQHGSNYTMHVPSGTYWLSNSAGCTVTVTN
jgi:hypothetical protein